MVPVPISNSNPKVFFVSNSITLVSLVLELSRTGSIVSTSASTLLSTIASKGKQFLKAFLTSTTPPFDLLLLDNPIANCLLASVTLLWVNELKSTDFLSRRCNTTATAKIPQSYPFVCSGQSRYCTRRST